MERKLKKKKENEKDDKEPAKEEESTRLEDEVIPGRRLIIEGEPGSGKSSLLAHTALKWAENKTLLGKNLLLITPARGNEKERPMKELVFECFWGSASCLPKEKNLKKLSRRCLQIPILLSCLTGSMKCF